MTNDFDQPIYMQQAAATTEKAGGAAPTPTDSSPLDSSDLSLLSESIDTNEHLDAYAAPPPIADGTYKVKLKRIDTKDGKAFTIKQARDGSKFLYTQHELTVIDPTGAKDGIKVYDRYVSTLPDRNKAVPMVAVLKAMGVAIPATATAADLWHLYDKASKGEPTITIETQWEANLPQEISDAYKEPANRDAKKYAPRVLGMTRFPSDGKGGHLTEVEVDCSNIGRGKVKATAQARVSRYVSAK